MKFINVENTEDKEKTKDVVNNDSDTSKSELDFNKTNREDYEKLMKESSTNRDGYWDSNNPFVKIFLLGLGVVIILGALYYIMSFMATR